MHFLHNTNMKKLITTLMIGWVSICAFSLFWNVTSENAQQKSLFHQGAKAFFQQIVLTRSWNAEHGGVYVPIGEKTSPNPYLEDPFRDLETREGLKLTKINPAFMTRQIASIALEGSNIRFHITSLKPIRPANKADEWEAKALQSFEKGVPEYREFLTDRNGVGIYRYMAPLVTTRNCLQCHEKQGYHEGDIRGGISVTLPIEPKKINWVLWISHITTALAGAAAFLLFGNHIARNQKQLLSANVELQDALDNIKTLSGFLPICARCKKIRDVSGFWEQLESYIENHSDALFSHGVCPECTEELYGDEKWYRKSKLSKNGKP